MLKNEIIMKEKKLNNWHSSKVIELTGIHLGLLELLASK
jgi:hypothetical protein